MKNNYTIGETLDIVVEKIVPNGLGMGFAKNLTIFVPYAAPGDRLKVELRRIQSNTAFAKIVEILDGSEMRSEPKCKYYGVCGGCDFQHLSDSAQLEAKVGMIRDSLTRIGKIDFESEIPIIKSPEQYGYRFRAQWHADTRSKKIGYFQRRSHDIVDAKSCPILAPPLEQKLNDLRENLAWESFFAEDINIEAACDASGNNSIYTIESFEPTRELVFDFDEYKLLFDAQNFFQANRFLVTDLLEAAIGGAKGKVALDLYSGVGLFSVPLSSKFDSVISVEANRKSVAFALKNVLSAGSGNVEVIESRVKKYLQERDDTSSSPDFVIIDPPRSGVKKPTLDLIVELGAAEIVYVSCNPSSLARDLRILVDAGYEIFKVVALDMFPQTHHVETVVRMKKS